MPIRVVMRVDERDHPTLPQVIPNSHVISSAGCKDGPDNLHFSAEGYRMLGERYADQMLSILNK